MSYKLTGTKAVMPQDCKIYEVRVYSPKGALKKVLGVDELHKKHWQDFYTKGTPTVPIGADNY